MAEKLCLYRDAGVREYWVVDPKTNTVTVCNFQTGEILAKIYKATDTVPVGIFPDFGIAPDQVKAPLDLIPVSIISGAFFSIAPACFFARCSIYVLTKGTRCAMICV